MVKTPNSEQQKAIEHFGGVLLKAGAGSGKTFVLIEHILFLTKNWIEEFKKGDLNNFEDFIKLKFSQVVMMTFTKMAAGEMRIRLHEKFKTMKEISDSDQILWVSAYSSLPFLNVTTIDGFCLKLIRMGFFPFLPTDLKLIGELERSQQIKRIFDDWIVNFGGEIDLSLLEILHREKKQLLSSFTKIFLDPELRLLWKKFKLESTSPESLGSILEESFKLNGLSNAIYSISTLKLDDVKSRSSFEKLVALFQETGLPQINSFESFNLYSSLFSKIERLQSERTQSKKSSESLAAAQSLVLLRDWISQWREVVEDYLNLYEPKVLPWLKLCQEIFNHLDKTLDLYYGITFADLEYFVALGLEDEKSQHLVHQTFSYFIIDEFQDTSKIQFKIIKSLIGEEKNKLFCVGDAKQAIYGFRGGELSVFQTCAETLPTVHSLSLNYRSQASIIRFNNSLFKTILPLGNKFSSLDPFSIIFEDQNVPIEHLHAQSEKGVVQIIQFEPKHCPEEDGKFSSEEINGLEAKLLSEAIQKELHETDHVCTVLYSKLRPSIQLIRCLIQKKISFSAQFKIELLDDPLIGIFIALIKDHFNKNPDTKNIYPLFMIHHYLKILGIDRKIHEKDLEEFKNNVNFWGLVHAFRKFIFKLNITNENADINVQNIDVLAELFFENAESILSHLSSGDQERISLELKYGETSERVRIMSAHASKGLEFDSVFLGGIYTNGQDRPRTAIFGSLPGSFQWYKDVHKKQRQKSPMYVLENEVDKLKDFSESKRLFYVACTRAKNKISWVDLRLPEKAYSIPGNSWVNGLNFWFEKKPVNIELTTIPSSFFNSPSAQSGSHGAELPFFFYDPNGPFSKGEFQSDLLITPELSVTRLISLLECPRKFYLSNILKLTPPDDSSENFSKETTHSNDENSFLISSTLKRGTLIHELISLCIQNNFGLPQKSINNDLYEKIDWLMDDLKLKSDIFYFSSEKQLKFNFFNTIISGTPDLVLFPKSSGSTEIWDFKTGKFEETKLNAYWFQLQVYAWALYDKKKVDKNNPIFLKLCFVDEKKIIEQETTYNFCREILFSIWDSQRTPWLINSDHCPRCIYGSICPR